MLTLGAGATSGISAIMIPQLQKSRNDLTTEMVSWIGMLIYHLSLHLSLK